MTHHISSVAAAGSDALIPIPPAANDETPAAQPPTVDPLHPSLRWLAAILGHQYLVDILAIAEADLRGSQDIDDDQT